MDLMEQTRPGTIPAEQWEVAIAEARHILISRAVVSEYAKPDMTYGEFAKIFSTFRLTPPRFTNIARLLEAVSRFEHEHNRPMLSILVVTQNANRPGEGFYELARKRLGWHVEDEGQFFLNEHKRVTDYWRAHA